MAQGAQPGALGQPRWVGWVGGGREVQEGIYVSLLRLIYVVVQQKSAQH